jgi:hypothetical protein
MDPIFFSLSFEVHMAHLQVAFPLVRAARSEEEKKREGVGVTSRQKSREQESKRARGNRKKNGIHLWYTIIQAPAPTNEQEIHQIFPPRHSQGPSAFNGEEWVTEPFSLPSSVSQFPRRVVFLRRRLALSRERVV